MLPESVVIVDSYGSVRGGATRVAIDEAVGLSNAGLDVTYFTAIGPISPELQKPKIHIVQLGQHRLLEAAAHPSVLTNSLWNSAAYREMKRVIGALNPERTVVHVHGFSPAMSSSPLRCCLDSGFQVVLTLHDYFSICPNGGFFDYRSNEICERRPLSYNCLTRNCDKRNYLNKLFRVAQTSALHAFGNIPRRLRHIIVLSQSSRERARPYLSEDVDFFFLRNPCHIPKAPPVDVSGNSTIATIGRITPDKGIHVLVEAAKRVKTPLLFVGDGPLRKLAEADGTNTVTGWLPREKVTGLFPRLRCLVFPSIVPEAYGLSVIDVAAKGIPTIASDVTGISEWIDHNSTGWRTRAGSVDHLASLLELTKSDDVVSQVGSCAYRKYWEDPMPLERHITELLTIYERLLLEA